MIDPHGGGLVNRICSDVAAEKLREEIRSMPFLVLDKEQCKDVRNIAHGVYSPITGFFRQKDCRRVVEEMRLANGTVWSIPVVLDIDQEMAATLREGDSLALRNEAQEVFAMLRDIEIYSIDKDWFASNVFGTNDREHPGVEMVYQMSPCFVGGEIDLLNDTREPFPEYNFSPAETRAIFKNRGWDTVVAFQTRNVPHRGHEFLQKEALKEADGLFIQPVIGKKKLADFKDEFILASYEALIDHYYPKDRTFLGILPLKMRYAGPREAVFHAIIRKNFGCSHFIVGRDHAGVGTYYPPFAAQEIFDSFEKDELGIHILKYPEVLYCPSCDAHLFSDGCAHEKKAFSGTKLRGYVQNKERPPSHIIRPEVFRVLVNSSNALVDNMYNQTNLNQQGFVLWFTGLSQSGKTTNADMVYECLKKKGYRVERLDGDVMREYLSPDLGFSQEDRNENIRRAGFVAKLLSRNGVVVIASFITPYEGQRKRLREEIPNFLEVFCDASLEICESRDTKGLYEKARKGEIENFTGISDPFERSESYEIRLDTNLYTAEENVKRVLGYLKKHGHVVSS